MKELKEELLLAFKLVTKMHVTVFNAQCDSSIELLKLS